MKQIKHRKYAYSSKTLLVNTLNSGRVNPVPSSMYKVIQPFSSIEGNAHNAEGHIETDLSTFSYFGTFSLEYPKSPCLIDILAQRKSLL